jgi:hypothetical protein
MLPNRIGDRLRNRHEVVKLVTRPQQSALPHQSAAVMFQKRAWNPSLMGVPLSVAIDRKSGNSYSFGQAWLVTEILKLASCLVPVPINVVLYDRLKAA